MQIPKAPRGSGAHPVALVVISSGQLAASRDFYAKVFGWEMMPLSAEVCACGTPAGPAAALRAGNPPGFPGAVPFLFTEDVDRTLKAAVAAGAAVERATWKVPMVGEMARFAAPRGTVIGLVNSAEMRPREPVTSPLNGGSSLPAPGAIVHVELLAQDFAIAAKFFGETFGWGTLETMPSYMAFDPGAGISGIFQSHTPALPAVAYISCTDAGAKLREIEAAGGKRMGEPMRMPGVVTFGYFTDPTGTAMGLIAPG